MDERRDDFPANLVTSPAIWESWSKESQNSFDPNYPIGGFKVEPGRKYGPFFKASGENLEWFFENNPDERNMAGLKEPHSKAEARSWYNPRSENPLSHIHKFYIEVQENITDAGGLIGKIDGGTEVQVIFNNEAIKCVVDRSMRRLPD